MQLRPEMKMRGGDSCRRCAQRGGGKEIKTRSRQARRHHIKCTRGVQAANASYLSAMKMHEPTISNRSCQERTSRNTSRGKSICAARRRPGQEEDAMALLLEERVVFLGNELDHLVAESVIASLLYLDGKASGTPKDIKLFINSPGGPVNPAMAVLDAIRYCRSDVSTVAVGLVASSASFALAAGTKGKRLSFPNSRIMIHQPLGDAGGFASEYEVSKKEMMYHKENMAKLLADMVGKPWEEVDKDTDRDRYMSAIEAMEYGIIDSIIGGREAVYEMPAEKADWIIQQDLWTPDRQYD